MALWVGMEPAVGTHCFRFLPEVWGTAYPRGTGGARNASAMCVQ